MRRSFKLLLILVILIMIASVFTFSKFMPSGQDFRKLTPPHSSAVSFKGTWKINEKYNYKEGRTLESKTEYIYLDENRMIINNNLYDTVKYKLRVVNLKEYLLAEYNISYKRFSNENHEVDLISPLNNNTLIGEILRLEENKLLIIHNDIIYTITKISSDVSDFPTNIASDAQKDGNAKRDYNDIVECVYIGLKSNRELTEDGVGEETYRTLWIGVDNGIAKPVYERENILYPRLKGFWELVPQKIIRNGVVTEYFDTYNINNKGISSEDTLEVENESKYVNLNFISNNYISIEEFTDNYNEKNSRYKIIPVDTIHTPNGVPIDVLSGTEGYEALKNSSEVALDNLENYSPNLKLDVKLDPTNIGVVRKNGRWVLEGRTRLEDNALADLKFDVNMINTKKLIIYDNLYVRWNIIKAQNPLIKDIYTSPNGKVAIVVLDDYILVYEIENSELKGDPIKRIKKDKNESVIMAEWTSGYIADSWEKVFKQDAKEVEN